MKRELSFLLLLCSLFFFSQEKIFTTSVPASSLSLTQRLSPESSASYQKTWYFKQKVFNISSELHFSLPDHKEVVAKPQKRFKYSANSTSYSYQLLNDPKAELVFSQYNDAISGMYVTANGNKYIFEKTGADLYAISLVNEGALVRQDSLEDFITPTSSKSHSGEEEDHADVCAATTPACTNATVDVMVVYTTAAKNAWGGTSQSNAAIATAITNFNTALQNSGVTNLMINLVYAGEINYTESGNINTDLTRLRNETDGFMDEVHTLRTTYGADLCGLVTATPTNTCGLGYLNTSSTNYFRDAAFTVSLRNCVVSNYTLAHEMAHNMGFQHDWYVSQSNVPCEHHHGYVNKTAIQNGASSTPDERWRTIMAYNNECATVIGSACTRINRWANPQKSYNGDVTGIEIGNTQPANEAYGFARVGCVVATFTPTAPLAVAEFSNVDHAEEATLFPNPATDHISIMLKTKGNYKFTIFDMSGKRVLSTDKTTISVRNWKKGEYLWTVSDEANHIKTSRKFLVK